MNLRKAAMIVTAGLAALAVLSIPALAKSKAAHKHHLTQQSQPKRYSGYLIPPPPAYSPTILPELQTAQANSAEAEPPKPESPYKKYVYTREGNEDPKPHQPNKYVTYWHPKS